MAIAALINPRSVTSRLPADAPTAPVAVADKRFSLRANLLRWATLTPDLGIEWRANDRWSLLFNASWTTWSWNDKDRRYALREFMPEVRYHFGAEKHWGGIWACSSKLARLITSFPKQENKAIS